MTSFGDRRLPERFWQKIQLHGECWIWVGYRTPRGYGRFWWEGAARRAHRVTYAVLIGDPGESLDHTCRNVSCVRPEHLEPVTVLENCTRQAEAKRELDEAFQAAVDEEFF